MSKMLRVTLLAGMGVGKSTLARAMEKEYGFKAVLERPEIVKAALSGLAPNSLERSLINELLFLDQRKSLLTEAFAHAGHAVVDMDILIEKIWGDMMLTHPVHRDAFEKTYAFYEAHLPKPDLVVYLTCTPEENLRRIEKRARSFETGTTIEFLRTLETITEKHVAELRLRQKLLTIDVTNLDFETNNSHVRSVVDQIMAAAGEPAPLSKPQGLRHHP